MILRMLLSGVKNFSEKLFLTGYKDTQRYHVVQLYSHYCPPNDATHASSHYEKTPNFKNSIIKIYKHLSIVIGLSGSSHLKELLDMVLIAN